MVPAGAEWYFGAYLAQCLLGRRSMMDGARLPELNSWTPAPDDREDSWTLCSSPAPESRPLRRRQRQTPVDFGWDC